MEESLPLAWYWHLAGALYSKFGYRIIYDAAKLATFMQKLSGLCPPKQNVDLETSKVRWSCQ